jgi:aminoglycoside phosphotransferase (APT) family kinase protein
VTLRSANLTAFVAAATGQPPTAITLMPRAPLSIQANRLYDARIGARHLIVKEYLVADERLEAPAREFNALTLLAPLDLAPQPVFYQSALGPVVVYEYMEGAMWDRQPPTAAGLAQLADVWLKLNAVPTAGLWLSNGYSRSLAASLARLRSRLEAYAGWVAAQFPAGRHAAELCLAAFERCLAPATELDAANPPLCFCRADPRFANVIQRPDGRLGLIDWEDSGLRDPARELADILLHPNQEDLLLPAEWQPFLQPYLNERSRTDPSLWHRAHLYQAIFPIFWISVITNLGCTRAGQWDGWQVNGLPANVRLRRFLARALAWPRADFTPELGQLEDLAFFPDN